MNCLLLLIILFCCNGNGNCNLSNRNVENCGRPNCRRENSCSNCVNAREGEWERRNNRGDCDCDSSPHTHTSPSMPRTQFPYLDVEPRTCGCEEKSGN